MFVYYPQAAYPQTVWYSLWDKLLDKLYQTDLSSFVTDITLFWLLGSRHVLLFVCC
jgi:hypothetical protein